MFGLQAGAPKILKDSNNTIVHLSPHPVVAKVGTSHFRDAALESLDRELRVALHLAERGAPVVPPASVVPPGPHVVRGMVVTLWQFMEGTPPEDISPADVVFALRAVHDALEDVPVELPSFSVEIEDAARFLAPARSPALPSGDRRFLQEVREELSEAVTDLHAPTRPLHGSPHERNWLVVDGKPLLLDFETVCWGPVEWDVAALEDRALACFAGIDLSLIHLLRRVRSLCVAAKCWIDPDRAPEVSEAARVHLKLLRGDPLD